MSRLSVLTTVYNEIEFLPFAIDSCIRYVDDLIIVEGAYQETIKLGRSPRSTDGTCEYINQFIQNAPSCSIPQDKLTYIQANESSDPQQRNVGLSKIKEINPDGWFMVVDGDEIYDPNTFKLIRAQINNMERTGKYAAYFTSITYVNDPYHYTLQEFPRLFKITSGCKFVNDNFLEWTDKNLSWSSPHVIKLPQIKYHHMAFAKGRERFELKRSWWMNRGLSPNFDYGWKIDENGKISDKNHEIFEYTGKHPDIIKQYLEKKYA